MDQHFRFMTDLPRYMEEKDGNGQTETETIRDIRDMRTPRNTYHRY